MKSSRLTPDLSPGNQPGLFLFVLDGRLQNVGNMLAKP